MASTSGVEGVKISNINLVNPRLRVQDGNPEFHVKISCEGKAETSITTTKKGLDGDRVIWNESFFFAGDVADMVVTFELFKTRWLSTQLAGSFKRKASDLILLQADCGSCKLDMGSKSYQLAFSIDLQPTILPDVVAQASEIADVISSAHDTSLNQNLEDTWTSFLSRLQIFVEVIDKIAEVHPYATLAWNIFSIIPKTMLSLKDRNESVQKLCEKLKETYDFFTDAERLPRLNETQASLISILVQQTIECGYFIREYSKGNIVEKIWKGAKIDDKIKAFINKFDHVKKAMIDSTTLEMSIATLRVSETVSEIKELMLLSEMPYARDAGFVSGKRCLPGTRQDLLQDIMNWVNDDTAQRVLVLSGAAGTGKSAVAHTIAEIFRKQNRLGSLFCFSRSYKDRRGSLFSTISRGLADGDVSWRKSLITIIEETAIRTSTDMDTQFDELILKPSKEISTIGPVVIVIDALDESGDRGDRKALLDLLFDRLQTLPTNYRFILTTRPETDIEPRCQHPTVLCKRMDDIAADKTFLDIQSYVSFRLQPIAEILDEIQKDWRDVLAKRSEGLFQWAETVCRFIDPTVHHRSLVKKRWKACTSGSPTSLYELYHGIISSQQESGDSEFIRDFKILISAIVLAWEPLTIHALENIFQGIIEDVKMTLKPFGSLLLGVHDSFTPVRPLHTSLVDFFLSQLQDDAKTNQYYVDISDQSFFTLGCLKLLTRTLRFNICNLETSHRRNRDIPDLDARVKEAIPLELSYACCFWASHLQYSRDKKDIVPELRTLMHEKFMYLFEALSLLKWVEQGCVAMRIVRSWCKDVDEELVEEALDAWQFGFDFGEVMTESTPHVYLSALPFTPSASFISKRFLPMYPQLLSIDVGPSFDSTFRTGLIKRNPFNVWVTSLVFSPRNRHIATSFDDGTFWIWDYETGEIVCQWKSRSSGMGISNTVFSPDGRLIYWCFRNGIINVCNVWTKEGVSESYWDVYDPQLYQRVHDDDPMSEGLGWHWCTISSDGRYVAFSVGRTQLVLYDREVRRKLTQFEYWASSGPKPAFSPNGNVFAFPVVTSDGNELWLWDTQRQALVFCRKILELSEKFALSDKHLAVSRKEWIEVWDISTLTKVRTIPVTGCGSSSLCFLNDGYLVGNCAGVHYTIWNLSTEECIVETFFTADKPSFAAFHESKILALSALHDEAVHIRPWDMPVESKTSDSGTKTSLTWFTLRGRYLIQPQHNITNWGVVYSYLLRIWDIRTANNVVFEAQRVHGLVNVAVTSSNERVYVAYITRDVCELHLWSDAEGDFILDKLVGFHQGVHFSTAGDRLISIQHDGVKMWDTSTRALIGGPHTIDSYWCWIAFPAVSAASDNFLVAYKISEKTTVVEVRDCQSGHILKGPFEISGRASSIASSADETRIVCSSLSAIDILNTQTGKMEVSLSQSELSPRLSRNRKYAAWVLNKNEIIIWDIDRGVQLQTLSSNDYLRSFFFSDDSSQIMAFYSTDGDRYHFDIWDVSAKKTTSRVIKIYSAPERRSMLFSDGNYLAFLPDNNHAATILDLNVYQIMSLLYEHHRNHSHFGMLPIETRQSIQALNGSTPDNEEMLQYALTAWNKGLFSQAFQREDSNGWILGPHGELLFWVPENRRCALWRPCITHIAAKNFTKLNFDRFVHGSRWTDCERTS